MREELKRLLIFSFPDNRWILFICRFQIGELLLGVMTLKFHCSTDRFFKNIFGFQKRFVSEDFSLTVINFLS